MSRANDALAWTAVIGVVVAAVALLAGLIIGADALRCGFATSGMSIPHRFKVPGGCQVQTRDGWVPLTNYRAL